MPTVDGKAIPKCLSTPCKVQIEEGEHRFVATLDRYEDAEMVASVNSNNQKIELTLLSNFGWLEMKPVMNGAANRGTLNVTVDGTRKDGPKIELDAGFHDVRVTHPCYDPVEFRVSIAKNKTETFDKELVRGKGGLELNVEYKGEPQAVAVLIDGDDAGSTPYAGEVPLCADVVLQGNGWTEKVNVLPKWHEVVQVTHKLTHSPEAVAMPVDATKANAYMGLEIHPANEATVTKYDNPTATLYKPNKASSAYIVNIPWSEFEQAGWGKSVAISTVTKSAATISFRFTNNTSFSIYAIGKYGTCN